MKSNPAPLLFSALALLFSPLASPAGDLPVTGHPVPELAAVDNVVLQLMDNYSLNGCTVGIAKEGRVIYQRGFGWMDANATVPMPENATMRMASVSKVFVIEAIKKLKAEGLDDNTPVFDLGQEGGGILDFDPWPSLQDERMKQITVKHLMEMKAGWATDHVWETQQIYQAMGLDGDEGHPPPVTVEEMVQYALGRNLATDPGAGDAQGNAVYSNFSFNVLVLVIEELTGQNFYTYLRQNLLGQSRWIPVTDFYLGQPFSTVGLREPHYFSAVDSPNLYDPDFEDVSMPYGGMNVEAMYGSSFVVASAATMLAYMADYNQRWIGDMEGSSSTIIDSSTVPGVDIVVICNERLLNSPGNWIGDMIGQAVDAQLGGVGIWPTLAIDGQWVGWDAVDPTSGIGSYDTAYGSLDKAMNHVTGGTRLKFHPGEQPYVGTLNKKLRLDAPFGPAKIGVAGP
ncbi:serine hydrolase domain-containing protein [Luteolibacter marinus]|uniref:serine hydrolase domain-containing protein n=1 Tax=Luteolibacter marinus TaxID=2776705 RepID=UPI001867E697|nr:serine hydrolase domain-containing protein [Luteolibacter marinus]